MVSDTPNTSIVESLSREYEKNMNDQEINKCLQQVPHTLSYLQEVLDGSLDHMLDYISDHKFGDDYTIHERQSVNLLKYILTDYHANCKKPTYSTSPNERTPFCENVLPIFKYFSAVYGLLSFMW